jgi:uncharacterized membrane protein
MSWLLKKRLQSLLRSSLWVMPVMSVIAAIVLSPIVRYLDRALGFQFMRFSPEGVRGLASTITGAMLSFIVFFFSVLLLTVQIAGAALSPRIIARPFRSRVLKLSLGLFVFTFVYGIGVVGRGGEDNAGQLAAALVILLCLISICVFLYVIEYVSKQLRPVTVVTDVAMEGRSVIANMYPLLLAQADEVEEAPVQALPHAAFATIAHQGRSGVLIAFNIAKVVKLATEAECVIELVPEVGDFIATGDPVFRVYSGQVVSSGDLLDCLSLDRERTMEQDPEFAFRIIVDIATKALSPAINDPTTAVLALDQIHYLLREVGMRRLDTGVVYDGNGNVRLVYRTPDWEDFVQLAVTEIRQFGAASVQINRRMRAMLENIMQSLPARRIPALQQELRHLDLSIGRTFTDPADRARAEVPDSRGLGGGKKAVGLTSATGKSAQTSN